jgi:hypothetical protein
MLDCLPHVYGAALAASCDEQTAQAVTERVFAEAVRAHEDLGDERRLAAQAVCFAMRTAPANPFAAMAPADREAVALARLAGYSVDEIALALGIGPDEAKRRLRAGLEGLALEAQFVS